MSVPVVLRVRGGPLSAEPDRFVLFTGMRDGEAVIYNPPNADQGTAKTKTIAGEVDLSFDLNTATSTLTYAILHKPGIVPESSIWDGIGSTIATCQKGQ